MKPIRRSHKSSPATASTSPEFRTGGPQTTVDTTMSPAPMATDPGWQRQLIEFAANRVERASEATKCLCSSRFIEFSSRRAAEGLG